MFISLSNLTISLKKMINFLFSAYFGSHFCYYSNSESQSNLRFLQFGYCFLNFCDIKPEQGETVFQFMDRLLRYFSRRAEMVEVVGKCESLVDLIIREQSTVYKLAHLSQRCF